MTPPMTPGRYLQLRREAAAVPPAAVAAAFQTEPHVDERARIALLCRVEADQDVANLTVRLAAAYRAAGVRFDPRVLIALVPPIADRTIEICTSCGCSWHDPCLDPMTGQGCEWTAPGLCSVCAPPADVATLGRAA